MIWISLIIFLSIDPLLAQLQQTPIVTFGGGLNVKGNITDIADNESPDMSNMISTILGISQQRGGSRKYIDQAISSFPITSLYRAYASTGVETVKALIMTNENTIFYSSRDISSSWVKISSNLATNQRYSYETMNNKVIIAGDQLADPIKSFDIVNTSMTDLFGSTLTLGGGTGLIYQNLRAKHIINSNNNMLYANVRLLTAGSTFYRSRIYYSDFLEPSSVTANRFIDYRLDDGEEITGLGNMFARTHIFKETTIAELSFNILHPDPSVGDQVIETIVEGFGCIAPKSLVNIGQYYIFLARDGIRLWDGGRRQRLTLEAESSIISFKIQPIIDSLIKSGRYKSAVGIYYPKKQWYVFAYESPNAFPKGVNNSVLIYDFNTTGWYPVKNWNVESLEVLDSAGDKGTLLYGSSTDGYVYNADTEEEFNDSKRELVIDGMNSTFTWISSSYNLVNVKEGTASLKILITPVVTQTSMSRTGIIPIGEWKDGKRISKDDLLSFQLFPDSISFISEIRVDLDIQDTARSTFSVNFTSFTISTAALTNGNTQFSSVQIRLSSFPILREWTDLATESFPFSDTLTFYGIRFFISGTSYAAISVDDVRIISKDETSLEAYRKTKYFDLGLTQDKSFQKVLVTFSKSNSTSFDIEFVKDFGKSSTKRNIQSTIGKEIFAFGYNGSNGVTKLSSIDFSEMISTRVANQNIFDAMTGTSDNDRVYWSDRTNNRMMFVDRSSVSVNISSFGALGTGTTNFDTIHQIAIDDNNYHIVDNRNNRIKKHTKPDGEFVLEFGSLGQGTTSFHNPSGIGVDDNFVYVADDSNYKLLKLTRSTYGIVNSIILDYNMTGETSLHLDENNIYVAYNKITQESTFNTDVVLERRDKFSFGLLDRAIVKPENQIGLSSSSLRGDITGVGSHLFISFTDDFNENGLFYIQKRLKNGFNLTKEYKSKNRHFGIAGDGLDWKSRLKREEFETGLFGKYLQIAFSQNELDNDMKLFNLSFQPIVHKLQ